LIPPTRVFDNLRADSRFQKKLENPSSACAILFAISDIRLILVFG